MATLYLNSVSQADFKQAIYTDAQPGDTIILPTGSGVWGISGESLYLTGGYTVVGQGDSTIIYLSEDGPVYDNGVIDLWSKSTFRKARIIGANTRPVTAFNSSAYENYSGGFRISDITYDGRSGGAYFVGIGASVNSGVIDNCRITNAVGNAEWIFARGATNAWQQDNTWGEQGNIFIEDCTFSGEGYISDANANARMVVRFNTVHGTNKIDGHGLASNSPARSVRNMEVYHNQFTKTGAGNWADIELRGGAIMVFNNTSEAGYMMLQDYGYFGGPWPNYGTVGALTSGNPTTITTTTPHGYQNNWRVWVQAPSGIVYGFYDVTVLNTTGFTIPIATTFNENGVQTFRYQTPYDYPLRDQIGQGKDGGPREPGYIFGNRQGSGVWPRSGFPIATGAIYLYQVQIGNSGATFSHNDVIQANRDFFSESGFETGAAGASVGTRAQMNSMTGAVSGYGFWVTDEGYWNKTTSEAAGQLYVSNGTGWDLAYVPYTYPHPSRPISTITNVTEGVTIPADVTSAFTVISEFYGATASVICLTAGGVNDAYVTDAFTILSQDNAGGGMVSGDALVLRQVINTAVVTEVWKRAPAPNATPIDYVIVHSGNYPRQPDNDFVYAKHGSRNAHVYVFRDSLTSGQAIARRNAA